jgi:hypothetical protein
MGTFGEVGSACLGLVFGSGDYKLSLGSTFALLELFIGLRLGTPDMHLFKIQARGFLFLQIS